MRRTRSHRFAAPLAAAATLTALAAGGAAAQQPTRGWIGVSVNFVERSADAGPVSTLAVVEDVVRGSPADRAGIVPGDTLLRIDGEPAALETFRRFGEGLRPGDRVHFALLREGRTRDLLVVAGERPSGFPAMARMPSLDLRIDSVRNAILRSADSLQVTLSLLDPEGRVTRLRLAHDSAAVALERLDRVRVEVHDGAPPAMVWTRPRGEPVPGESFPIEWFVFGSPRADSLQTELARTREEAVRVRREELQRERQLARALPRGERRIDARDPALVRLRQERERLEKELEEIRKELDAFPEWQVSGAAPVVRPRVHVQPVEPPERTLGVSSFVLANNAVAGARLTPLNAALAEYFGVRDGVLVTEVAPGTPAGDAGLRPGDVVVRVAERPVRSVDDLRGVLAREKRGVVLTVVRKGERIRLTLPH